MNFYVKFFKLSIKYKNIFYYRHDLKNKKSVCVFYNQRINCFLQLTIFLQKHYFFKKVFLNIMFKYYSSFWYLYLYNPLNISLYNKVIKMTYNKYYNTSYKSNFNVLFWNYNSNVSNYLNFYNINRSLKNIIKLEDMKNTSKIIYNQLKNKNSYKVWYDKKSKLYSKSKFFKNNFKDSNFTINFLRVQRRYNKRRYSRVRAYSRSPFFASISLSSIILANFWGGTIKSVDWSTSWIINIDINLVTFIIIFYLFYRIWRLNYFTSSIRYKNKIKISNIIHKLFIIKFNNDK